MWSGLESVGVIFLIFAIGFFLHHRRIWPEGTPGGLSFVVVKLAAPCLAVTSITARFDRELLSDSLVLLLVAAVHILILFALAKLSSGMLRLGGGKKTVYEVTFTYSNVIFIGLPINQIVFGEEGVPFLFAYYIVILAAFWSFGVAQIASAATRDSVGNGEDGARNGASDENGSPGGIRGTDKNGKANFSLSKILNPGFIGVLVGAGLVQAGLALPSVLDTALGYLANLTVPLSLLVIGANLTIFAKGVPRVTADEIVIMLGKFVISPLVMIVLLRLFGVTGMPFYVFLLSSSMPCHMQTSILAQHYGVESAYASKLVGLSTLLSMVTIPAYVTLIHHMM